MLNNRFLSKLSILFVLDITSLNADNFASLLFHGNCTTCHIETKALSAPSVIEFKKNYLRAFNTKEDFIKYMSEWVEHPNEEGSLMSGAIEKYKLMPELGFDKSTLEIISAYIYDTDFTKEHKGHKIRN